MYKRIFKKTIDKWIDSREILIIYGARQVGKTTFLHQFLDGFENTVIFNCELPDIFDILQNQDLGRIKFLFGQNKIIALDEAQNIPLIGKTLKLIYDELPEYKMIVTGSSSFELSSHVAEALTGRNIKFMVFSLVLSEISQKRSSLQMTQILNELLIFGTYPGLIDLPVDLKIRKLYELTSDYLFKDVLIHERIKNPAVLRRLLKALAFQTGSQVSIHELSNLLGVSRQTVANYIELLEKSFIIFRLGSFSSNLRNEIKKSIKIYFYDNGIRNAILNNLNPVQNRTDIGILWENFCISERVKQSLSLHLNQEFYFWRTYDGAEIDLLELKDAKITAFEFKWKSKRKLKIPESFAKKYQPKGFKIISSENFYELMNL
ncbi:MAG: ATP-binding protein [Bacteroidales bacterium]|nr:ATP-binding protein [Bacteroidales bacterium]